MWKPRSYTHTNLETNVQQRKWENSYYQISKQNKQKVTRKYNHNARQYHASNSILPEPTKSTTRKSIKVHPKQLLLSLFQQKIHQNQWAFTPILVLINTVLSVRQSTSSLQLFWCQKALPSTMEQRCSLSVWWNILINDPSHDTAQSKWIIFVFSFGCCQMRHWLILFMIYCKSTGTVR